MENRKTNWGLIIGIIVATVAVLSVGAILAVKLLKKKKCDCCDDLIDDSDICVLDDDTDDIDLGDKE